MTVKKLLKRNEVPTELTWDLEKIYPNLDEWYADAEKIEQLSAQFTKFKGNLASDGTTLLHAVELYLKLYRKFEKMAVFASMKNDQDTTNSTYQKLQNEADHLGTKLAQTTAYFQPELARISDDQMAKLLKQAPELEQYHHFLMDLRSNKDHLLSEEQESLLAGAGSIFGAPEKTFEMLSDADLKFPIIEGENHQKIQLSEGVYGKLLESTDQTVRKNAFDALYDTYGSFRNTFASTLTAQVQVQNYQAKVHKYDSARQAAMAANHIPVEVYDVLIEQVHRHLPLLHRYVELRKKILKLDQLHMYDLYTPITGKSSLSFTYEQAKQKALDVLEIFGKDYVKHVKEAFDQRWIDVVENQGKRTGAYSSGMYDTAPYILLNWQDGLENLFTLVHEMGHSMHSYYTTHNQPYQYGDYSIFIAEIASTTNENLLTDYLLEHEQDPQIRAYVLNHYLDGFKGSVFRQTQFAEFEQWLHEQDAQGKALTADSISEFYGNLNQKYYGPAIYNDPRIKMEWMRIPHFYYDFYVYQYATGFAAATTFSQRIEDDDPQHTEQYLNYLKSGSSDYPIEVMKKAGVDMTKVDYLEEAFAVFEKRLNELEEIIENMKDL